MERNVSSGRPIQVDYILLIAFAVSLAFNVALGLKLKGSVSQLKSQSFSTSPVVGTRISSIDVETIDGRSVHMFDRYAGRKLIVYAFTTVCPWCKRNLASINGLAAKKQDEFETVGIAIDDGDVSAYLEQHRLQFSVYRHPSDATRQTLKLGTVPQTTVISADGRVLRSWTGAYAGSIGREITGYFAVPIPLLEPPRLSNQ
jgi:peroxiredoxin